MISLIMSFILSFSLAFLAYVKKSMTKMALLVAFIFAFIITYLGGIYAFFMLAATFIMVTIAGSIKSNKKDIDTSKKECRNVYQIIANVGLGTLLIIIYFLTKNNKYILMYAVVMAEAVADSLASDIGILSKKEPINILTFKKGKPGMSGNISMLGMGAALFGALEIALIYFCFHQNLIYVFIIIISGFLGAFIDTILGATIEIKYKCTKCGVLTEQKYHCEMETMRYKGMKIFNNDMVNFLSNVSSAIICILILKFI